MSIDNNIKIAGLTLTMTATLLRPLNKLYQIPGRDRKRGLGLKPSGLDNCRLNHIILLSYNIAMVIIYYALVNESISRSSGIHPLVRHLHLHLGHLAEAFIQSN